MERVNKIMKWVLIIFIIVSALYYLIIMLIGSYYIGNNGTGRIKYYEFEKNNKNILIELKLIDKKSKLISIKDSINSYGGEKLTLISIRKIDDKLTTSYIISYPSDIEYPEFNLIYINNKTNDDYGWFSLEKYKGKKLFEETIIEPLSKKYKRIE